MCLVKTALCLRCLSLFLGPEPHCWKIQICRNYDCARQTRRGAARWIDAPYPCSSLCDSEPCGQTLAYHIFCLNCIYDFYRFNYCPILSEIKNL
jgi:hypothetical protein